MSTSVKYFIMMTVLLVLNIVIFYRSVEIQKNELFANAYSMSTSINGYVQKTMDSVQFINTVASEKIKNKNSDVRRDTPVLVPINSEGDFTLNDEYFKNTSHDLKVNIAGYSGIKHDRATQLEVQMSLELAPYFKMLKEQNNNYAWLYYYSNKNFLTLYPFVDSNIFRLKPDLKQEPLFQYATPKLNPDRKLFCTPLYMDTVGKGLMITIGKPVYDKDMFLGVTEIDITLNVLNKLLKRLDILNNKSILINDTLQVLGQNNIHALNTEVVSTVDQFIPPSSFTHLDTKGEIVLIDFEYVYLSEIKSLPLKFIYFKSAYLIWWNALIHTLPAFLLMLFIAYISNLYSKTKRLNAQLVISKSKFKKLATRDYMTGIYNRRYFFDNGKSILLKAIRKKSDIAVGMIDIDDFKSINDTYGHVIGDEVIMNMTKLINDNLRASDLFARLGGDEFCILLEDISEENVVALFEKIRAKVEQNNLSGDTKYTLSFGIAFGYFESLAKAIDLADKALYTSKSNGKDQLTLRTYRVKEFSK